MKYSIKFLAILAIVLPIIHIIMSYVLRFYGFDFYADVFTIIKLYLIPLGFTLLLWFVLSTFLAKKFISFLHYLIYRNRNRPKSIYFFTDVEYPTSIGNYLREALYPTALFLSILMFILSSGPSLIQQIFTIQINLLNMYFLTIFLVFPILSTFLIAPVKLIDWSGFRYYNSKRSAIFQVGQKVGTLFNSLTGIAVILSVFMSILSVGLIVSIRVIISILFYILPLNILLVILLKFLIVPKKGPTFKEKIINDKKYKITPSTENTEIKFE